MSLWQRFLNNTRLRRFVILLFLIGILFAFHKMISIILLTFIFSFLIIRLINWIQKRVKIPSPVIVVGVYLLLILLFVAAVTTYVPKLIVQSENMIHSILHFYKHLPEGAGEIATYVSAYIKHSDFSQQLKGGMTVIFGYISKAGSMGFTFVMSLLLSFFFTVEKDTTFKFSRSFLEGPYSWIFKDIYHFAKIFTNTFGVVLEAQFLIAIVNTILTCIGLAIIGVPQIASLAVMIFVLSLIPVAGVIVSTIPMSFVAYTDGGFRDVIYVLIMLLVIHAIEAYILNPKFMSSRTELPIFYTFVVLFVSERLFGTWGLIVGIPIFTFLLNVLEIEPHPGRHQKLHRKVQQRRKKGESNE